MQISKPPLHSHILNTKNLRLSLRKRSSFNSPGYLGICYFNCQNLKSFPWTLYTRCPSASQISLFLNAAPALSPMPQMFFTRCWKKMFSIGCSTVGRLGYFFFHLFIYFTQFIPRVFHLQIEWGKKWVIHMSMLCTFPVRKRARELKLKPLWTNMHPYCKHNKIEITQSYILISVKKNRGTKKVWLFKNKFQCPP